MKKLLALFLAVLMLVSVCACGDPDSSGNGTGGKSDGTSSGDSTGDNGRQDDSTGGNKDNKTGNEFPRFTGFDGTDPTYAALANCKMVFEYDRRMVDGVYQVGVHKIECTFMACLDRCYVKSYISNFEDFLHGNDRGPDAELATVIDGNTVTQYDFYNKIVVTWEAQEFSNSWYPYYPDFGADWVAAGNNMDSWPSVETYGTLTEKQENIDRGEKEICGIKCPGVEQRRTTISEGTELVSKICVFYYDPDSKFPLYYEYHDYNSAKGPYPVILMKEFGVNCVRQSDIDAIIAEKYTAHKDEFRTMTTDEYNNFINYGEEP